MVSKLEQELMAGRPASGQDTLPSSSKPVVSTFQLMAAKTLSPEKQLENQINSESGLHYISLQSGRRVGFRHVYIVAQQVEALTRVHALNERSQNVLSPELVADIAPSIERGGVSRSVLAIEGADGIFEVFDGSRRRFGAILHKKGLPLSYTDEKLSAAEIREISHTSNLNRPNSLYDKGQYYKSVMEDNGFQRAAKLAEHMGISAAEISYALTAVSIPSSIFNIFPSKTELGRPMIQSINGALKKLTKDEDKQTAQIKEICDVCDAHEGAFLSDKDALSFLVSTVNSLVGGSAKKEPAEVQVANFKLVPKKRGRIVEVHLPENVELDDFIRYMESAMEKN